MKANELMIGDWVRQSDGEIITITSIDEQEDGYWQARGADRLLVEGGDFEPIPLTAEILEKNGFVESGMFYRLSLDYYGVFISEITESIWRFQFYNHECPALDSTICIGYVHELQHALRLCGIDKEIVL